MGICVEERREGGKTKGIEMRERQNICDWVRDTSLGDVSASGRQHGGGGWSVPEQQGRFRGAGVKALSSGQPPLLPLKSGAHSLRA